MPCMPTAQLHQDSAADGSTVLQSGANARRLLNIKHCQGVRHSESTKRSSVLVFKVMCKLSRQQDVAGIGM